MTPSDSFWLTKIDKEGLLLDLKTGSLFRLNETATEIWGEWLAGVREPRIVRQLEETYGLAAADARRDVTDVLTLGESTAPRMAFEFLYERCADGYSFSKDGISLLVVDEQGQFIRANRDALTNRPDLFAVLLSVSPKLIALRGHFILHASAVVLANGVVAFCGESGAGKTTTARSMIRAGATEVCEDKLIVRLASGNAEAVAGCETRLRSWVETVTRVLWDGGQARCDLLDDLLVGPSTPLREIGFIAADRRSSAGLEAVSLSIAETAGHIFGNLFYGSAKPETWRRQLELAVAVASVVRGTLLTMPDGLAALQSAATTMARCGSLTGR
jgi:hypothetical protein